MFMNPDSMELKTTMFLPNSTIATGQLCPDQRRMPQIVSVPFGFIFFLFQCLDPTPPTRVRSLRRWGRWYSWP